MKTEAIKQQIIANYKQLSQLAYVKATKKNVIPTWGITYKNGCTFGFVNQSGLIERNNSAIRIVNQEEIQLQRKSFLSTWKRTLKNINKMLQKTISDFNNEKVVKKRVLNIHCFSEEMINKLSKYSK